MQVPEILPFAGAWKVPARSGGPASESLSIPWTGVESLTQHRHRHRLSYAWRSQSTRHNQLRYLGLP